MGKEARALGEQIWFLWRRKCRHPQRFYLPIVSDVHLYVTMTHLFRVPLFL